MKLSFMNEGKDKDISRTKVEGVCHQQYLSKENTEGGTSGWKKVILMGRFKMQEGIKCRQDT